MTRRILTAALAAASLILFTVAGAAENSPEHKGTAAKAGNRSDVKATQSTPAKLVDINSATKKELKQLSGVGDAEADRIIAGRPYRSKADLVTRGIVRAGVYESIRRNVVARPKSA